MGISQIFSKLATKAKTVAPKVTDYAKNAVKNPKTTATSIFNQTKTLAKAHPAAALAVGAGAVIAGTSLFAGSSKPSEQVPQQEASPYA